MGKIGNVDDNDQGIVISRVVLNCKAGSSFRGYSNCTGPGFALHSEIVMPYITNYGTQAQKEKFIPRMVSGEVIGALGMTEPGAGR